MTRKMGSKPRAGAPSASVGRRSVYRREQERMHTRVKRSEEGWEQWRARMKDRKRSM